MFTSSLETAGNIYGREHNLHGRWGVCHTTQSHDTVFVCVSVDTRIVLQKKVFFLNPFIFINANKKNSLPEIILIMDICYFHIRDLH